MVIQKDDKDVNDMIVTFCGHGDIQDQEKYTNWLNTILPTLIEGGADTFYLGGYGDFDRLSAAAVWRQKDSYPHIESVLVLPYLNRKVDETHYDRTTYPPLEEVPQRLAIVKRNEWMVNESDIVVSGVIHDSGGAARTRGFARRKKKVILQFPTHKMKGN